jgi:hypothetical protein
MNNNIEPYIFIIDLDGTIIGNCSYQCDIYNIMELIKTYDKKNFNKCKVLCEKSLSESYNEKSLLIRPHFFHFIQAMKKLYPVSYFYVYTASEKKWANKEISIIEKNNNFKFDRPLLTRDNCIIDKDGSIKKSINKILPLIKKNIKFSSTFDIKKHLLIIDNNPTFIDYKDNLLICPTYNYVKFNNLKDVVPEDISCGNIKNYISKLTKEQRMCRNYNNPECLEKIYKWLYKKCKKINKYNLRYINDNFWKDLVILIKSHNIMQYTSKNVDMMQKSIMI